ARGVVSTFVCPNATLALGRRDDAGVAEADIHHPAHALDARAARLASRLARRVAVDRRCDRRVGVAPATSEPYRATREHEGRAGEAAIHHPARVLEARAARLAGRLARRVAVDRRCDRRVGVAPATSEPYRATREHEGRAGDSPLRRNGTAHQLLDTPRSSRTHW